MTCKYAYDMGHGYKPLCERGSTPVPARCDRCDYRYEELEHENERLRELFYESWEWMQRARYDRSIRANEMDEIGVKAIKLGFPDHELGIEV